MFTFTLSYNGRMDVLDAIQKMLNESGKSQNALAEHLGRTRQSISNMFRTKADVRVDTLARMAEFMGYKLILKSKDDTIEIVPRKEGEQ